MKLDDDDRTARNRREACARHGVSSRNAVSWNVVPFPVAGVRKGGSTTTDGVRGVRWTGEFVQLCPRVEIVLLLGASARDGWDRAGVSGQ